MILKSNRVLRFFSALLLFIAGSLSVFATDGTVYDDIDFKSKKQVDEGITNQLDFLIDFNTKNEKNNKPDENWYVYIVGEDTFDAALFSDLQYVESQLDLSDIGLKNTPLDIVKLNDKLIEINKSLSEKKLPLIYYGVANKKKAIPAPFFPFEGQYNVSNTDSEKKLLSYYFDKNLKEYGQDEAIKNVNSVLWNFYKNEKDEVQEALLTKTLAKSGGSGAIALSTYYLAFIKSDGNGKAKLLWWSLTDHKHSETYFDKHPIDLGLYKKHYQSLSNSDIDKNYARINAWYNYFTGADVPDSEFLSEMLANYLNNPKCANLSTADAEKLKKDFIAKITAENKDEIIAFTEQLCPAIVLEVDYDYIIKAIKTIAKDRINENGEAAVLVLMYGIKTKDYGSFFKDLKEKENTLLNRLLVQMDDASLNPYDKDHYSSFIGQLLYMGYQNNGEYLKKERIALAEALLKYKYEIDDLNKESIDDALAKIVSFNLDSGESAFEEYLVKDDYKMMLEFVNLYTKNQTSLIKSQNDSQEVLRNIADAWGKFFAERSNEEAYIKLLGIAFTNENAGFAHNIDIKDNVAKFVFRMLANVPQEPYKLYQYFTLTDENGNLSNLEKIIKKTSRVDYDLYGQSFYEGLTKILDSQRDIKARIQIVKWAIEDDDFLNNSHENMVVNIFKNIQNAEDKKEIYNFLTYKNGDKSTGKKTYEYFSKITDQGILSGSGAQTKFVNYYINLIQEGIGSVEDRIAIVRKVLSKGDDWSMLWFANDTEDLVSSLFNDLNRGDAEYVIGELRGENGEYELFREIWQTLQSVNVPATFDRDNSQLLSFATSIGGLLKLTNKETVEAASHYEKYLDQHHNYLNSDPSTIPQIDGNYLPMVRANFFNYTEGNNKHDLETAINPEVSKDVSISLEIGGSKVMDKSFDPFEYVFVEFIEDTEVNGNVKFSKGDIIGVPAFYIAWMKGTIDSQQNNVAFVVGMDAMVVVVGTLAVVYSGGALTPFILAATKAEILFAGIHIPLTIYNKEAKETLGEDFVMGLEIAYMITSVATLPDALATLPKNLVTLRTQAGKVIDYTKGGVITAGTKIEKITIDVKEFTRALPELLKALKNDPAKKQELFKRISDFESHMRTKMQGFGSNVPAEFRKAYDQLLELTKQFYLANMPAGLASIINKLPSDKLQTVITNKLLTYTFDGKPILGIDAQGILHHVKKYKDAENYTTLVGDFKAKVELESGEQYETTVEVAKKNDGEHVFRTASEKLQEIPIVGDMTGLEKVSVNDLTSMIQSNGTRGKGATKEYADKFTSDGYNLKDIEPVKIIELPDGTKVIADVESHYRAAAMTQAGGTNVPVQYMTYDELLQVRPSSKRQRELTELYFMLKVGQQTDSYKSNWLPDMSWEGEKELFYDIPERIDNFLTSEFPNLTRTIPLRSVDELLNHVDFPQAKKSDFKDELSSSPEKAKAFGNNPDLVDAWGVLYDIEVSEEFKKQLNNVYAMDAYIKKVAKNYNNVEAESFNKFVKHQIDKDAYMKSILSTELYGGIDISHVSLNHVEPIGIKLKTPQYSGAGKFGAYEARIKNGIIERYVVGDNGVGKWQPLNGNTVDDVNFVITTDGKLRIGHGHYNISAEAQSVYSAGKLQIVNGKVTEVSNYSGHYLPPNDNLYQVEKVFRELKIISDDFKIFENPNAVKSASPPINTTTGFKYTFEKEGYVYAPKIDTEPDGTKTIKHFIEKEGAQPKIIGHSTLTKNGDLENTLEIPETLRQKEISKAIYAHVLKEDVKRIPTEYGIVDGILSDNLKVFKNEFNKSKDPVQAILETPEGRVLRSDWEPIDIQVKDNEVLFVWVKKGTGPKNTDKYEEIIQILRKFNPDCN